MIFVSDIAKHDAMPKHGNCGKARPFYWASTAASANWRYITDEDREGPRKNEIMFSTTDAKKSFALETSDISTLTGLRHQQSGYRSGSTLTMYYRDDLVALSVKKWGQAHFDEKVPEGRKLSGAEAREQAMREQEAAVSRLVNDPYSVVPADRLSDFKLYRLQAMVQRLEGGKKPPWPNSKEAAVSRIIAAGYSEATEAAHMAQQRVVDEAERVRLEAERAARVAAQQKAAAEEAVKKAAREAAAEVRRADREKAFAAGELRVEDLNYQEMHSQLKELANAGFDKGYATGKERMGLNKVAMLEILKTNLEEKRKRGRSSLEALAEGGWEAPRANMPTRPPNLAESTAAHGAAPELGAKKPKTEAVAAQPAALPAAEQAPASSSSASAVSTASASAASTAASTTAVPAVSVKPAERKVAHTPLTSAGQGAVSKVADIRSFFGKK